MRSTRSKLLAALGILAVAFGVWRLVVAKDGHDAIARMRARGLPTNPAELDVWYQTVPASENLANAIIDASAGYRAPHDATNTPYTGRLAKPAPPFPVDPRLLAVWRQSLSNSTETFAALESGRGRTASRYPLNLRMGSQTLLPHLSSIKGLAQFLALAAITHAESGQSHEAARDVRDILLVARSLESEPLLISQLVRIAILNLATGAAGTSLPRAALDDAEWATLQAEFARAAATNGYYNGMVGETAMAAGLFGASPAELSGIMLAGGPGGGGSPVSAKLGATLYVASGLRAIDAQFCLDRLGEMLEAARRPFPEALALSDATEARVRKENGRFARGFKILSGMMLPALGRSSRKDASGVAVLRSAVVGCAIERHRLAHAGRIPDALAELVPTHLAEVPADPFDGKPLRYRHTNDTYTVYSLGEDGVDDGGEPQVTANGGKRRATADIGFRVTDRRR
ncbi:MAG: hypothetical protein DVB31_12690 [Verrucomicrobia bacterium]|nr:MAG: hypothetical protein DVB31_12690 [Verrucomicrobiota bacterium]